MEKIDTISEFEQKKQTALDYGDSMYNMNKKVKIHNKYRDEDFDYRDNYKSVNSDDEMHVD